MIFHPCEHIGKRDRLFRLAQPRRTALFGGFERYAAGAVRIELLFRGVLRDKGHDGVHTELHRLLYDNVQLGVFEQPRIQREFHALAVDLSHALHIEHRFPAVYGADDAVAFRAVVRAHDDLISRLHAEHPGHVLELVAAHRDRAPGDVFPSYEKTPEFHVTSRGAERASHRPPSLR